MACPYFRPIEPLDWSEWQGAYRPPLGRLYGGCCHSDPSRPHQPPKSVVVEACNLGYARARCDRLPEGGPDAVRFSWGPQGAVRWVVEADHLPVESGVAPDEESGPGDLTGLQVRAFRRAFEESE